MTNQELKDQLASIIYNILEQTELHSGDLFVLGCSSSEVVGGVIGKQTSEETGILIVETILTLLNKQGIHLAVQGCEHINRALILEKDVALKFGYEIVSVIPALQAGGACATAAFSQMSHPVAVEHIIAKAGIDIGDTAIGMHVKHVQIPIRPIHKTLGEAHVTALGSRPKLIGGPRAVYVKP